MCVCVLPREAGQVEESQAVPKKRCLFIIRVGNQIMKLYLSARIGGSCHYFISTDLKGPIRYFY